MSQPLDPAWQSFTRPAARRVICAFPGDDLGPGSRMELVPLVVHAPDVEFSQHHHHHHFHFQQCQLLRNTVSWPVLKRSSRLLCRVERIVRPREPALRDEFVRRWPIRRVALHGLRRHSDQTSLGRVRCAVVRRETEVFLPHSGAGDGGKQSKRLFDHGDGKRQFVQ